MRSNYNNVCLTVKPKITKLNMVHVASDIDRRLRKQQQYQIKEPNGKVIRDRTHQALVVPANMKQRGSSIFITPAQYERRVSKEFSSPIVAPIKNLYKDQISLSALTQKQKIRNLRNIDFSNVLHNQIHITPELTRNDDKEKDSKRRRTLEMNIKMPNINQQEAIYQNGISQSEQKYVPKQIPVGVESPNPYNNRPIMKHRYIVQNIQNTQKVSEQKHRNVAFPEIDAKGMTYGVNFSPIKTEGKMSPMVMEIIHNSRPKNHHVKMFEARGGSTPTDMQNSIEELRIPHGSSSFGLTSPIRSDSELKNQQSLKSTKASQNGLHLKGLQAKTIYKSRPIVIAPTISQNYKMIRRHNQPEQNVSTTQNGSIDKIQINITNSNSLQNSLQVVQIKNTIVQPQFPSLKLPKVQENDDKTPSKAQQLQQNIKYTSGYVHNSSLDIKSMHSISQLNVHNYTIEKFMSTSHYKKRKQSSKSRVSNHKILKSNQSSSLKDLISNENINSTRQISCTQLNQTKEEKSQSQNSDDKDKMLIISMTKDESKESLQLDPSWQAGLDKELKAMGVITRIDSPEKNPDPSPSNLDMEVQPLQIPDQVKPIKQISKKDLLKPIAKKKRKGLTALNHALPKNLQECQDRFFESKFKVNPQFEYENEQMASRLLNQFQEPDGQYLEIAKRILESFLDEYQSETAYLEKEGKVLDQFETQTQIHNYIKELGVGEYISVNFQKNQVAPTSVTHDPKSGKCKMNIKLPCEYRAGRMIGVLDHEIGTHFLRKYNEKSQKWHKKRDKHGMVTCIATEEGLACVNQLVQTVKDKQCKPFLYRQAINYYAAFMAKQMSFVELFKDLEKYVDNPLSRWKVALRVKRGLTDSSRKGGLYKDQVYLEGAVKILSLRHHLDFKSIMTGKISLNDYHRPEIFSMINYDGQILPPFMEDMSKYIECLDQIAEANHIEKIEVIDEDDDVPNPISSARTARENDQNESPVNTQ